MLDQFKSLRKLNLIAGGLHLASLLAILFLSTDVSLPVVATYMSDAPGTGNFAAPIELFSLNISYTVAAFMALSAFFHFFVSSGPIFPKYVDGLKRHINIYRWVEYSLSSSIMIVIILQLNGVTDYIALIAIFGVNVSMILFGWLQERYSQPGSGDMLPFWFGCIAGAVPWIAIFINMLSPSGPPETTVPGFVIGIVISLFIFFICFAIVQWKQYKAQGKWADYLHGERWYIILSLVAKSLLAWQVFVGALM
ncbi:MAG: heliorhodopsin HeR [Ilumatobacteraceae bacterium]|nr:heliorhodopsin HeR [Ilumatobacteraceae bacterium]